MGEQEMLDLQRELERQTNQAEKDRLRQEMDHQREIAARDQQVLRDAMERSEEQMKMMRDQMRIQDERFESMRDQHREQNKADIEQLVATLSSLNQQMEQVVYDPDQPDSYMKLEEQNFDKFCSAAAEHLKGVPKMPKKSIAVLG